MHSILLVHILTVLNFLIVRCEACRENWPVVQEMFVEAPQYRCENCRAPLATEDKFERKFFTCCVCKHK